MGGKSYCKFIVNGVQCTRQVQYGCNGHCKSHWKLLAHIDNGAENDGGNNNNNINDDDGNIDNGAENDGGNNDNNNDNNFLEDAAIDGDTVAAAAGGGNAPTEAARQGDREELVASGGVDGSNNTAGHGVTSASAVAPAAAAVALPAAAAAPTDASSLPPTTMIESVSCIATKTRDALEEIWNRAGMSPDNRERMYSHLVEYFQQLCDLMVQQEAARQGDREAAI